MESAVPKMFHVDVNCYVLLGNRELLGQSPNHRACHFDGGRNLLSPGNFRLLAMIVQPNSDGEGSVFLE